MKIFFISHPPNDTGEFSSEITISFNFTAEHAKNAEASENSARIETVLKLCVLCALRGDKSLYFYHYHEKEEKRGENLTSGAEIILSRIEFRIDGLNDRLAVGVNDLKSLMLFGIGILLGTMLALALAIISMT